MNKKKTNRRKKSHGNNNEIYGRIQEANSGTKQEREKRERNLAGVQSDEADIATVDKKVQ